jgi:hypothetical protein
LGFPILLGLPNFFQHSVFYPKESTVNCESPWIAYLLIPEIPKGMTNLPQSGMGAPVGCANLVVVALTVPKRPIPDFGRVV